jgi:Histidine kinase-, DNA gyrase B-, and HSP90-like ATPase
MATEQVLSVVTDSARDLLQSADFFSNEKLVAWEYISNGLQYVDPGTSPHVDVVVDTKQKRMVVSDNGSGMTLDGLKNFFVMHGENVERKHGKPGRGRFGTGKSAAFGIADSLRITTVRDGMRSIVELTRADIEASRTGEGPVERVPVRVLGTEQPVDEANGTVIEIDGLKLAKLDPQAIVGFVERHLAVWPNKDAVVTVNGHVCEYHEPPTRFERSFMTNADEAAVIGNVELTIKVAKAPLDEEMRGIAIFANGVWHETTLAGLERKEYAEYLFGEVDVPRLDDEHELAAFDATRRQQLNRENPLVRRLIPFIGRCLDEVRGELAEEAKTRKESEQAKRLAREAARIEDIINQDFQSWRARLSKVLAKARAGADAGPTAAVGGADPTELTLGGDLPAVIIGPGDVGHGDGEGGGGEVPTAGPLLEPKADGEKIGAPAGGADGAKRSRGGFSVEFEHLGESDYRAKYVPEHRAIYINLDHAQVATALAEREPSDPVFRRLAYEVALTEYALALARELDARQWFSDTGDALFEIRDTIDRVAKLAAALYAD